MSTFDKFLLILTRRKSVRHTDYSPHVDEQYSIWATVGNNNTNNN